MSEPEIFVSYSHQDKEWVRNWLLPRLEKNGLKTHVDFRDFEIGVPSLVNMERAVEKCAKTIPVYTPNWIESEWTQIEALMVMTDHPMNLLKKLSPIMLHDCLLPKYLKSFYYADFQDHNDWEAQIERLIAQIKMDFAALAPPQRVYTPLDASHVYIERLPETGYELFGRQKELQFLDEVWETDAANVVSFKAFGGVGKSTLVKKWVERLHWDGYRGAEKVYAWSFYSQGTNERVTSADAFVSHALDWFGDDDPAAGSPWDKGKRLASLVRRQRTLLLLDGMEPLQSAEDFERGRIKDPALSALVRDLARENPGLCVITTREPVADLARYPGTSREIDLERISAEAGRALLRLRGVQGSDEELERLSESFGNHTLAINLLAEYLRRCVNHPAALGFAIPDLGVAEEQGRHARRVLEAFAIDFGDSSEAALLHVMGLFNQPAPRAAIMAVTAKPAIPGLTEWLAELDRLLGRLRECRLLDREHRHQRDVLDCHPVIREHFGQKLRAKGERSWREAHSRLYEYYKSLPKKKLPDTLVEMEPLFAAVTHGCQAGKYQECLDDIYFGRIRRKNENYVCNKVGAFGSDLSALSNFFEKTWSKIVPNLTDADKAVTLSWAGFRLRALGRLREAAQPMQAGMELSIQQNDWKGAAQDAGNLSELYLTLGDVEAAVSSARQSVEFADRSGDDFQKESMRTALADALYQAGEPAQAGLSDKAEDWFREAEAMQGKSQPEYRSLYSLQGFRFCDLLLSQGNAREVLERYEKFVEWRLPVDPLLDHALEDLSAGRAYLLEALDQKPQRSRRPLRFEGFEQAADYLNQAVAGLRESGYQYYIPLGLFARAFCYRLQNQFPRAWDDLEEAREIAERGDMKLWLADYHLEACRLCLADPSIVRATGRSPLPEPALASETLYATSLQKAEDHLKQAADWVQQTGYYRRDPELVLLRAQLAQAKGDAAGARSVLAEAKAAFDRMGIRERDWEIRELESELGKN